MGQFSSGPSLSQRFALIRRRLADEGLAGTVTLFTRFATNHLIDKWRFAYFEFLLSAKPPVFASQAGVAVQIATPADRPRIEAELFPTLAGDLAYDRRYFEALGQDDDVKCFLAESGGKIIHYSWVFLDATNSPLLRVPFNRAALRAGDAYIGPVFTSPSARGLVYLQVLSEILRFLHEGGRVQRLLLMVDGRRPAAVAFYRRLGFRQITRHGKPVTIPPARPRAPAA